MVSSKNYPPVPPVSSSEGCSSQCEQVPVSGSDSVPNSFFLYLSTSFRFLLLHEIHKEKFSRKSRKKKSQTGVSNPRKFAGQRNTEQLQSADLFEVRSSAEERACGNKPQSSIPMKRSTNISVGKRRSLITGCSTLLQKVEKSADYYCFCNGTELGPRNFMNSYRR